MRLGLALLLTVTISILYGQQTDLKISGMTLVAPRDSFASDPMPDLVEINCKWVAVVPYAFTPQNEAKVYFGNNHQWWGETPRGAESTIQIAHQNGLNVMLKPQLWMHNSWVGALDFETDEEWRSWEQGYRDYILTFAEIAQRNNVAIFCVGTEFKIAAVKREKFWRELIEDIRKVYSGYLTYCANWDEYPKMPFWDALDIIGVSAYFPLSENETPSVDHLRSKWKPIKSDLKKFSARYKKQILFTEYGYLSVDGCAGKTWELEKRRRQIPQNEMAQSNSFEALYATFCDESFWAGGFMWKWYPNGRVRPGFREHDYTPQGKVAEKTISKWYGEF